MQKNFGEFWNDAEFSFQQKMKLIFMTLSTS